MYVYVCHQYNSALSEVPSSGVIAGVRIGLIGDKFVVNPTTKEMEDSKLDLLLAGTESAILMIEVYGQFLSTSWIVHWYINDLYA